MGAATFRTTGLVSCVWSPSCIPFGRSRHRVLGTRVEVADERPHQGRHVIGTVYHEQVPAPGEDLDSGVGYQASEQSGVRQRINRIRVPGDNQCRSLDARQPREARPTDESRQLAVVPVDRGRGGQPVVQLAAEAFELASKTAAINQRCCSTGLGHAVVPQGGRQLTHGD